jgi:polyhydroxyalkanoate synthesis regulator phasin
MKQLLNEQFIRMQKLAGIITENQEFQPINESFEDLLQQLSAMAEKGEISNDEIKKVASELMSARRRGQSNARKSSPDYEEKKLAAISKAAVTRDQNKKDLEKRSKEFQANLAAEKAAEEKRRTTNKLPLTISAYGMGVKGTKKALEDFAKYYSEDFQPAGPGGQDYYTLELKPKFKDQSFDGAEKVWNFYDGE